MNLKEVLKTLVARFQQKNIDFVLSGGLALSTMGIFRFTKDIDFVVQEESKEAIHEIGHVLGLKHCKNNCVMQFSNTLYEAKAKPSILCNNCKKIITRLHS